MYVEIYQRCVEISPRRDILATRELKYLAKMSWRNVATFLRRKRDATFSGKKNNFYLKTFPTKAVAGNKYQKNSVIYMKQPTSRARRPSWCYSNQDPELTRRIRLMKITCNNVLLIFTRGALARNVFGVFEDPFYQTLKYSYVENIVLCCFYIKGKDVTSIDVSQV